MTAVQDQIRQAAREVLESGQVSMVIGWAQGSVPVKTTPAFIEKPQDVDKLVWNPACVNNLSVYLPKLTKDRKVAIVAKPCDIRSLINLIKERQVNRDNVYIIGLGCGGVVDAMDLDAQDIRILDIINLDWKGNGLEINTKSGVQSLDCSACLRDMCLVCTKREPALYDVKFGEPSAVPEETLECVLPELPEDRRQYWSEQFAKCIRCYACRQVCPSCYCESCFADRIEPKWTAKKASPEEAWMFHATRSMHLAGRCISCGECERACPVDIPVAQLIKELNKAVKDKYNYEAGDPNEDSPLLGQYKIDDVDPASHGG